MPEHELPTATEMFHHALACVDQAHTSLGDASDWLRSDWRPLGTSLTDAQGNARSAAFDLLSEAKNTLNDLKARLDNAAWLTE